MPTQQAVTFGGSAGQLEGVLHLPDRSARAIAVVTHPLPTLGGTMDNKVVTTLVRAFVEAGCAALRFNFRGTGASQGNYDAGDGETSDTLAATQFLQHGYPGLPLFSAGFSFGAYVQARAAEQLQPRQLILIAPAVGRFAMPAVAANTLLVHGDLDEVVSLQELLRWATPQQLPIVVLPGAGHFFHGRLTQLKQIVLQNMESFP